MAMLRNRTFIIKKLKIFNFILDHRLGGPHLYVSQVTKFLKLLGVRSMIITTGRGPLTELSLVNLRHFVRSLYPLEILVNVAYLCWIFRKRETRTSVIFDVHGAGNLAPIVVAKWFGVPLVWHFHEASVGRSVELLARIGKAYIKHYPHICIGVSQRTIEAHCIPEASILYAPIDLEFWKVTEREREERARNTELRIVSVGNLNPIKGMDQLLEAVSRLDVRVELVIIGAELSTFRSYAAGLYEQARQLELRGHAVRFLGWQPPEAVRGHLARGNVFVLASHSEAGPMVLYEAMAMECVCVISDVGDAREIVGDEDGGFVIERVSPGMIVRALKRAEALGVEGRRALGQTARQRLGSRFSVDEIGRRHVEIYRRLLSSTCCTANSMERD